MRTFLRVVTAVVAALVLVASVAPVVAGAQTATTATISGTVLDSATGLAISGVTVTANGPSTKATTTNSSGAFALAVAPGIYTLSAQIGGYQAAQSDSVTASASSTPTVTLSLQRAAATGTLQTIGRTSSTRGEALSTASVVYRSIDTRTITEQGFYRIGDALRQLPGINQGSNNETATPADDMSLTIRGIGRLETQTLIDGHPVGLGLRNPFNFEITPASLFSDAQVIYGSGADAFFPTNAIGGIVNLRTLEPTAKAHQSFTQQYGSFGQLGSLLSATGTFQKVGYAFAASSTGLDGPFRGLTVYNPAAALDPSSPGAYQQSGTYQMSNASFTRSLLGKLAFNLGTGTRLTLSGLGIAFYDDKTGNGDNDYLRYETALAQINAGNLGSPTYGLYDGMGNPVNGADGNQVQGTCPNGLLSGTNTNGVTYGAYTVLGPNKSPGVPGTLSANAPAGVANNNACFTPAQLAAIDAGWQGAGEAYQTYNVADGRARLQTNLGAGAISIEGYSDGYRSHYDRNGLAGSLPYNQAPGDTAFTSDDLAVNAGFIASDTFATDRNTFSFGFSNNVNSYRHLNSGAFGAAATAHENAFFVREAYTFANSPLSIFANAWAKHSTVTNTSYLDPRLALVYATGNNVLRIAAGATSTQPTIADVTSAFTPTSASSLTGARCTPVRPCSIGAGSAASSLRPERGVDTEFSIGHRFAGNSIAQLTLYNTNVSNKLYSYTAPITLTGTARAGGAAGIAPYLGIATNSGGVCVSQPYACLGITGDVNVGQVIARGIELTGRQQLLRDVNVDYDYGTESVSLVSADQALLRRNSLLIQNAQLPYVPLHKYNVGLDWRFLPRNDATFRIAYHHVGENNPKNAPPYGYADMRVSGNVGPGRLAVSVNNVFNNLADVHGYFFEGVPLATNQYAQGAPASTELFLLPYRSIQLTFTISR